MAAGGGHWIKSPFFGSNKPAFMPAAIQVDKNAVDAHLGDLSVIYNPDTNNFGVWAKGSDYPLKNYDNQVEALGMMATLKGTGLHDPVSLENAANKLGSFNKAILDANDLGYSMSVTQVYSGYLNHLMQFSSIKPAKTINITKQEEAAPSGGLFED